MSGAAAAAERRPRVFAAGGTRGGGQGRLGRGAKGPSGLPGAAEGPWDERPGEEMALARTRESSREGSSGHRVTSIQPPLLRAVQVPFLQK